MENNDSRAWPKAPAPGSAAQRGNPTQPLATGSGPASTTAQPPHRFPGSGSSANQLPPIQ
ncbi:hypothetical protein GGI05_005696, partial [Coemansia sp. RSA 2603]